MINIHKTIFIFSHYKSIYNLNCFALYSNVIQECKKHLESPICSRPNPETYERLWSRYWKDTKLFEVNDDELCNKRFSLLFPPPNITGNLHCGHALTASIQDALIRYKRMSRENISCLFIPGYDHAGIATFLLLVKLYYATKCNNMEDTSHKDIMNLFDEWKNSKIENIRNQLDRLGTSLDYSKEYFTLDSKLEQSVISAFIQLFDQGLIHRYKSLVNWSYFLKSTISEIEIKYLSVKGKTMLTVPGMDTKVEFGVSHKFAFPVLNGKKGEEIIVATNCIETLPGDVAVAVHPNDVRYSQFVNRQLLNPLTGARIPVILDEIAKPEHGTGAVKITPSCNLTDHQVALRHNLKLENFYNENGVLIESNLLPQFSYLTQFKHRYQTKDEIIKILSHLGLYRSYEEVNTKVPICSRSGDIILKRILPQWFLKIKPASQKIKRFIELGFLGIQPENHKPSIFEWLNKSEDWCISRQIPLGHRIPAFCFTYKGKEVWIAANNLDEARSKAMFIYKISAENLKIEQDKDVLDTWFSSALLPFSALGWPNVNSSHLQKFYPLSLIETGYDILNFWVLRMMILALYLTKKLPFNQVYLHGMVCDGQGKKMSKSKGNVIDPLDVIEGISLEKLKCKSKQYYKDGILSHEEFSQAISGLESIFPKGIVKCGADALRLSLFEKEIQAQVMRLGLSHIIHNRNLINKMWQTYIFFHRHLNNISPHHKWFLEVENIFSHIDNLSQVDKWMLSHVSQFIVNYPSKLESFLFDKLYKSFHRLWVQQLCDIFIEVIKPLDNDSIDPNSYKVLALSIKTILIALHPLIPFITEELYQRLCKDMNPSYELQSIQKQKFPNLNAWSKLYNPEIEENMKAIILIKRKLLAFISSCKLSKTEASSLNVQILNASQSFQPIFKLLEKFTSIKNINFIKSEEEALTHAITLYIDDAFKIFVKPNQKLIDSYFIECNRKIKILSKNISNLKKLSFYQNNFEYEQELANYLRLVKMEKDILEKVKHSFSS